MYSAVRLAGVSLKKKYYYYSAPSRSLLRGTPWPATAKRDDFSYWQKADILLRGSKRSSSGSPFQVEGSTIEEARHCLRDMRARGTRTSLLAVERRDRWEAK